MSSHETFKRVTIPAVVVVRGSDDLVSRCRQAARITTAVVHETDAAGLAGTAASSRPFAIVMTDEIYELDPAEHDALAKDVGARIVRLSDGAPVEAIESLLYGTFLEWEKRHAPC